MWKKLLTPTLIITLVILFSLTWYCSIQAEKHFRLWVDRANETAPALITTELADYQRQFFTAEATTVTRFGEQRVELHHLIRHYVWGVTIITTPTPEQESLVGLQIVTDVGPTGTAEGHLNMPLLVSSAEDVVLTLERITGEWTINAEATSGIWNFSFDQARLQLDDENLISVSGWNHSGEMSNLQHLPLGTQQTLIDTLTLTLANDAVFSLKGLALTSETSIAETGDYRAATEMTYRGMTRGTDQLQQGRLDLELTAIKPEVIATIVAANKSLHRHLQQEPVDIETLEGEFLSPVVDAIFASGLVLNLNNLSLTADDGLLTGTGILQLPPKQKQEPPITLLDDIHARLNLEFDPAILSRLARFFGPQQQDKNEAVQQEELRMLLQGLAQLDFINQLDNDRFHLDMTYEQGKIKLNDKPFRLF